MIGRQGDLFRSERRVLQPEKGADSRGQAGGRHTRGLGRRIGFSAVEAAGPCAAVLGDDFQCGIGQGISGELNESASDPNRLTGGGQHAAGEEVEIADDSGTRRGSRDLQGVPADAEGSQVVGDRNAAAAPDLEIEPDVVEDIVRRNLAGIIPGDGRREVERRIPDAVLKDEISGQFDQPVGRRFETEEPVPAGDDVSRENRRDVFQLGDEALAAGGIPGAAERHRAPVDTGRAVGDLEDTSIPPCPDEGVGDLQRGIPQFDRAVAVVDLEVPRPLPGRSLDGGVNLHGRPDRDPNGNQGGGDRVESAVDRCVDESGVELIRTRGGERTDLAGNLDVERRDASFVQCQPQGPVGPDRSAADGRPEVENLQFHLGQVFPGRVPSGVET